MCGDAVGFVYLGRLFDVRAAVQHTVLTSLICRAKTLVVEQRAVALQHQVFEAICSACQ